MKYQLFLYIQCYTKFYKNYNFYLKGKIVFKKKIYNFILRKIYIIYEQIYEIFISIYLLKKEF